MLTKCFTRTYIMYKGSVVVAELVQAIGAGVVCFLKFSSRFCRVSSRQGDRFRFSLRFEFSDVVA